MWAGGWGGAGQEIDRKNYTDAKKNCDEVCTVITFCFMFFWVRFFLLHACWVKTIESDRLQYKK